MTDSRSSLFSLSIKVFARLFQKAVSSTDSGGRAPQSAKSSFGVFFFVAFSFAPSSSKEKAEWTLIFCFVCWIYLGFYLVGELTDLRSKRGRRRRDRGRRLRRPAKKHEETFLLSYFCMTKSTKSHIRSFLPYVSSLLLPAMFSSNNHRPPVRT